MKYPYNRGYGCGIARCDKITYRTRTRATRFGSTAGIPEPVLNAIRAEHTPMSAPQLATVLEVAHNVTLNYSLEKYQCYWYALIVFFMVRKQTRG